MVATLTSSIHIQESIDKQRTFFGTGKTKSYDFRVAQLNKLLDVIQEHDRLILDAVYADLRKPAIEAYGSEVLITLSEI
ncbi:MAG: aldehyde dehydrogenase family protein, partial [Pseudanabaena sp.]